MSICVGDGVAHRASTENAASILHLYIFFCNFFNQNFVRLKWVGLGSEVFCVLSKDVCPLLGLFGVN